MYSYSSQFLHDVQSAERSKVFARWPPQHHECARGTRASATNCAGRETATVTAPVDIVKKTAELRETSRVAAKWRQSQTLQSAALLNP